MENEAFLRQFLSDISGNTSVLEGKLKYYTNLSLRQRILNYLAAEQLRQQSRTIILSGTKKALAAQLGVQRSSLSRELQKMREAGLISFDRRSITVVK